MEILDPDLWDDDGKAKPPSQEYMQRLDEAQMAEGGAFAQYARIKRHAKENRAPEIGDIVHLLDVWEGEGPEREPLCRAAIVMETETMGHGALLRVHIPHEAFADWQASHDELKAGADTWHWSCSA